MIHTASGDLLTCRAEALVNTVNTVGVMGKGIALQFKRAYPEMYRAYERACKAGKIELGRMWVWQTAALDGPRLIINFPTKGHWRSKSKLSDVDSGLADLVRVIREHGIASIAVPPLGCGNGGLDWNVVRPRIERALAQLNDVEVYLFEPSGAPLAAQMRTATARPRMTRGKAALVLLLHRYVQRSFEVSIVEAQKLMYFLQESGEELRLEYVKGHYGPYADNLNHVLKAVEGHFISGFGDGSRSVAESEPLVVLADAVPEAERVVASSPDLSHRIEAVLRLASGFESAYDMELLATVHWVSTRDDTGAAADPAVAGRLVRAWSARKQGLFGQPHVEIAWTQLHDEGWLDSSAGDRHALFA